MTDDDIQNDGSDEDHSREDALQRGLDLDKQGRTGVDCLPGVVTFAGEWRCSTDAPRRPQSLGCRPPARATTVSRAALWQSKASFRSGPVLTDPIANCRAPSRASLSRESSGRSAAITGSSRSPANQLLAVFLQQGQIVQVRLNALTL